MNNPVDTINDLRFNGHHLRFNPETGKYDVIKDKKTKRSRKS